VVCFTLLSVYSRGKSLLCPLDRKLGGSQSRSGRGDVEKNLIIVPARNWTSVVRPVASSPHSLSYHSLGTIISGFRQRLVHPSAPHNLVPLRKKKKKKKKKDPECQWAVPGGLRSLLDRRTKKDGVSAQLVTLSGVLVMGSWCSYLSCLAYRPKRHTYWHASECCSFNVHLIIHAKGQFNRNQIRALKNRTFFLVSVAVQLLHFSLFGSPRIRFSDGHPARNILWFSSDKCRHNVSK
jgi:hypothetical protein